MSIFDSHKNRIRLIFSGLIIFSLLIVARLYFLQIVHGVDYSDRAEHQYVSPTTNIFERGSIYFSNKDGSLLSAATLKSGYLVSLNPKKIQDGGDVFTKLSSLLPINSESFYAKASKSTSAFEKISNHVSEATANKITAEKIAGVEIQKEKWRYYPSNSIGARTIGFVGFDSTGTDLVGRYGLENYYEDTLKRDSNRVYVNFFAEIFTSIGKAISSDTDTEGDIVTSLEPTVQGYLDQKLTEVQQKYSSQVTGGIIIDPNTGEIYAMGLNPTFNLNDFSGEKDVSVFNNPLVEGLYEMGSIMKAITMAIGLDTDSVTANTTYNDRGSLTLNTMTLYNFDHKARGVVDMQQVLNQSLNVGAAFVESKIGNEKYAEYMKNFGLGEETGIDLPAENHGRLENLNSPRDIEYATASFGQGISLTPIATVRALSALANGGKLIKPHLVKKINYKTGLFNNISYVNEAKQIIKKETSEEITRMLVNVVDVALANGKDKMEHYSIAAKTGTAQIAKPGAGYYTDRWLHSFFGYFPAYNPRFLVFLYTVEPKDVNYASQTLTDPFMDITKFLISYYDLPPDR